MYINFFFLLHLSHPAVQRRTIILNALCIEKIVNRVITRSHNRIYEPLRFIRKRLNEPTRGENSVAGKLERVEVACVKKTISIIAGMDLERLLRLFQYPVKGWFFPRGYIVVRTVDDRLRA